MIAKTPQPESKLPLRKLWEQWRNQRLSDVAPPEYLVVVAGSGIKALEEYLQRAPLVADLESDRPDKFETYLINTGRAAKTIHEYVRALTILREYAIECGILAPPPKPDEPIEAPPARRARYSSERMPDTPPDPSMLLSDYLNTRYAKTRVLGERTLAVYQQIVSQFCAWSGEPVRTGELCDGLLNDYLTHSENRDLAPDTLRTHRRVLLTLWHHANRHGYAPERAKEIRLMPLIRRPPQAWSFEEVQRLLGVSEHLLGYYPDERHHFMYREHVQLPRAVVMGLAIRIAWDTALRQGDIFESLTQADFGADGTGSVIQRKTKRWHYIKIHPETLHAIRSSYPPERKFIVPWQASMEWFRREFKNIVQAAGLKGSFKKLRKSSGSEVENLFPGCGAAHLGHVGGGGDIIARAHYIDPRLYLYNKPMPRPLRELPVAEVPPEPKKPKAKRGKKGGGK